MKVLHFNTGEEIPKGAIYLNTLVKVKKITIDRGDVDHNTFEESVIIYHYFLVKEDKIRESKEETK